MRLTIVPGDKAIYLDGTFLLDIQQDWTWVPSNVHAIQWYDTWGEIEYNDGTPNEQIAELGNYSQATILFKLEKERLKQEQLKEKALREASTDWWAEFRALRNKKLLECDWTQLPNVPISEEKKAEWEQYRQTLRNLTDIVENPKPYVESLVDLSSPLDPYEVGWPRTPD